MSQPSGPQEGSSTNNIPVTKGEGEPPIVEEEISLAARVSLYHGTLGTDKGVVQKLVLLKTTRQNAKKAKKGYNPKEQNQSLNAAERHSQDHGWKLTDWNMGCYLASGLVLPQDLNLAIGLTPEEIEEIEDGENLFPTDHPARMGHSEAKDGANDRLLANRSNFPDKVKREEWKRHAKQAKQGSGPAAPQLTPESVRFHTTLVGQAAREIQEKREQKRREEGN